MGIYDLKQNPAQLAGPPPSQRQRRVYNLGNGNTTPDENVAKKALLERDYKEIADFETIQQNDYKPGLIGAKFLPSVLVTKIPKVAEPLEYDQQYQAKPSQIGLIILPRSNSMAPTCGCYKKDSNFKQLMNYTNRIYQQAQRSQPIIYLDQSKATQAFDWVTSAKTNDMITNSKWL